jgi:hypothetical protein
MSDPYVSGLVHPNSPVNTQKRIVKVLATTAAEQLTPTRRFVKAVNLTGYSAVNTANANSVYFGFDSGSQVFEIPAGQTILVDGDFRGWDNDLSKIWIRGTAADGVVANFQEGVE